MYNKTIIGFGFCDMQNNQCLGKSYQPRLRLDGSKIELKQCASTKTSVKSTRKYFVHLNCQCQINMNLVSHISEDGSEIELKHCRPRGQALSRHDLRLATNPCCLDSSIGRAAV